SRRRHTRWPRDWSSDVCSSDLALHGKRAFARCDGSLAPRNLLDSPGERRDRPLELVLPFDERSALGRNPPLALGESRETPLERRSEEHTSELSHVAISYAVFCL